MSDIRKRTGAKGTTYQVRYASPGIRSPMQAVKTGVHRSLPTTTALTSPETVADQQTHFSHSSTGQVAHTLKEQLLWTTKPPRRRISRARPRLIAVCRSASRAGPSGGRAACTRPSAQGGCAACDKGPAGPPWLQARRVGRGPQWKSHWRTRSRCTALP